MIDVAGVLPMIVANDQLRARDHAGNLCAQFFPRIALSPKRMPQIAIQPVRMARPMAELVQRHGVVSGGFGESFPPWQVNRISSHPIKRSADLRMLDLLHFHVYTLADFCGHKDASDYGQKDTSTNESN